MKYLSVCSGIEAASKAWETYDKQYWNRDNIDEFIMDLSDEKKADLLDFIETSLNNKKQ